MSMSNETPLANLTLEIAVNDAEPDQLDRLTRQLLREIREIDVDSAELAKGGEVEAGAKAGDVVTIGAITLAVLPTVLPKLIDFMQAWTMRGRGRTVKFKGKIGRQNIEFEGSPEDLEAILDKLSEQGKTRQPNPES